MIHLKFLGTCLIFWKMCVVYCWLRKKEILLSWCWPLYPRLCVFLNPDGENKKVVNLHFVEFLPNQFFSHWFLRADPTSCKWCFQIVKGNIFITVAFKLLFGVLTVFSDCVYLVCHLCVSPTEGLMCLRASCLFSVPLLYCNWSAHLI